MATNRVDVLKHLVVHPEQIRRFGFDDLDSVCDIENRSMPFGWSKNIFRSCLVGPYECWKLEQERRETTAIVGYYVLYAIKTYAELCNICVDASEQRAGYGTSLLAHAINWCANNGITTLALEVRQTNTVAKNLYTKFGFETVGIRKNYYAAAIGREDAEMMELQINL